MGNWFSSTTSEKVTEVNGQSTNVIVEEGLSKIDTWHTVILLSILILLVLQTGFMAFRIHKQAMKRKYLNRMITLDRQPKV